MHSQINLPVIFIGNLMGIVLLINVLINNPWKIMQRRVESRTLKIMVFTGVIACIADPLASITDGGSGLLCRGAVFWGNTLLYLANMTLGYGWINFSASHLGIRLSKRHHGIILAFDGLGILLLILNIFKPIVFSVDATNTYSRTHLYWYFLAVQMGIIIDSLIMYQHVWRKSGMLKFFPMWTFIIPVLIGVSIQSFFYGLSTTWPFIAVSISCVTSCLQNELIFRDKLTGLYNRSYLTVIEDRIRENKAGQYSGIMIDVNGFKGINDTYGHIAGDEALCIVAALLRDAVNDLGEVVRYAGDEFIIILNTQDSADIETLIHTIRAKMEDFNRTGKKPYSLSVSIGFGTLDMDVRSMDVYLDEMDRLMYEDKHKYYEQHPDSDRRRK